MILFKSKKYQCKSAKICVQMFFKLYIFYKEHTRELAYGAAQLKV